MVAGELLYVQPQRLDPDVEVAGPVAEWLEFIRDREGRGKDPWIEEIAREEQLQRVIQATIVTEEGR
jgi:hypothetical protein